MRSWLGRRSSTSETPHRPTMGKGPRSQTFHHPSLQDLMLTPFFFFFFQAVGPKPCEEVSEPSWRCPWPTTSIIQPSGALSADTNTIMDPTSVPAHLHRALYEIYMGFIWETSPLINPMLSEGSVAGTQSSSEARTQFISVELQDQL